MDKFNGNSLAIEMFISPNVSATDCYLRQWYDYKEVYALLTSDKGSSQLPKRLVK